MRIIADLHIHSKYSRAVSQKMNLQEIGLWASKKGIDLVGTGDWTHPMWIREIQTQLEETQQGIFRLKHPHPHQQRLSRFLLSTELSSIYSQGGKTRRIHTVVFVPSIATALRINKELTARGSNLLADGRPILGISAKHLLELILSIDDKALIIPAHAWTPWFSLYGSKSGFDSIEECFGTDGARSIYAVETGLSSDPLMNWQIAELQNRSLVSFSDAHSGPKLGREATVFVQNAEKKDQNTEFTYQDIADAVCQKNGLLKVGYTIEFFPEEGKYHWTGHRACNVLYSPKEEKEKGTQCPVCHLPLTVGVESRVMQLSSKHIEAQKPTFLQNSVDLTFVYDAEKKRRPFVSLVPLLEILTEIHNGSPTKASRHYDELIGWASEFDILLKKPYRDIEEKGGKSLSEAIRTVRQRKAVVHPGYDGVFGTVHIFTTSSPLHELPSVPKDKKQLDLF